MLLVAVTFPWEFSLSGATFELLGVTQLIMPFFYQMESHRKTLCNSCWNWTTDLDWIKVVTFSWTGSDVCHFCCFIIRCVFVSLAAAVDGLFWFHFYFTSRNFALGGDNDYPTDRRRRRGGGGGSRRRNEPVLFFFFLFPQAEGCGHCWWLRRFELFFFLLLRDGENLFCFQSGLSHRAIRMDWHHFPKKISVGEWVCVT